MKLYYRTPRNESVQPRNRTNHKAHGSMNEDTEKRIVALYTCGQSIESITKEVGRARYLVVHVLQSRGVFGNRGTEPDRAESRTEPPAVEKLKAEPVNERKPDMPAVKGPETEGVVEKPPRKARPLKKCESPKKVTSSARPKPSRPEKTPVNSRWSPPVLDALYKLVGQHDLNPDMSLEDVQKMASKSKRQ